MDSRLLGLILVFAPLSLFSFGGGQAIIADMQVQVVDVQGWLTAQQFADVFALSRAAPGPSTLIAALIGWQVAGFFGALIGTLAIYVPSSIVMYAAVRWWHARADSPWRAGLQRGLAPVAMGLVFAGALSVLEAAQVSALQLITTFVALAFLLVTKIGPYPLMIVAALVFVSLQFL
jgi:chromate transporter